MSGTKQKDKQSHLIGIIAGVAVAATLVATGALLWKYISERQQATGDEDSETTSEEN